MGDVRRDSGEAYEVMQDMLARAVSNEATLPQLEA